MSKNLKILLLILVIGLGLRLFHLSDKAYGTDEIHSINNSKAIYESGLNAVYDFGNPPLFYYFVGFF